MVLDGGVYRMCSIEHSPTTFYVRLLRIQRHGGGGLVAVRCPALDCAVSLGVDVALQAGKACVRQAGQVVKLHFRVGVLQCLDDFLPINELAFLLQGLDQVLRGARHDVGDHVLRDAGIIQGLRHVDFHLLGGGLRGQLRFHLVKRIDVGELEGERAFAGEAHCQQGKAVTGQVVGFAVTGCAARIGRAADFYMDCGRLKIELTRRGQFRQQIFNVAQHVLMLLAEHAGDFKAGCDGASVYQLDGGLRVQCQGRHIDGVGHGGVPSNG